MESSSNVNPFTPLTLSSPSTICLTYEAHRTRRNAEQRALLLSPPSSSSSASTNLKPDATLLRILTKAATDRTPAEAAFDDAHAAGIDERHNLVFWARPPELIKRLITLVQMRLEEALDPIGLGDEFIGDGVLFMIPPKLLHLTVLEIASAQAREAIGTLLGRLQPAANSVVNAPATLAQENGKKARLGKPLVCFDGQGFALSFLPMTDDADADAVAEGLASDSREGWTYHHLRSHLWDLASPRVPITSRYVVPSAHLTILRWGMEPVDGVEGVKRVLAAVDEVNAELEGEFGRQYDNWFVGEEEGLELRAGACWYGGGGARVAKGQAVV